VEVFIAGGSLVVAGLIIASLRKFSAGERLQQAYFIASMILTFLFAVGSFSVMRWLFDLAFSSPPDMGYLTMGGWIIVTPLIIVFIVGFSRRRKSQQAAARYRDTV
jgi:hypothetical protein